MLRRLDDEAAAPGEVREDDAPLWWHGDEEAAEGMMSMMGMVRGGARA